MLPKSSLEKYPIPEKGYSALAEKIDKLQAEKNNGRGVSCVKTIVDLLRRGELESAKAVCFNEGDKISSYPDIADVLKKELFKLGEKNPFDLNTL